MSKFHVYNIKGADILVLQNGEDIEFFMNYKTSDFIFCCACKGELSEIDENFIWSIWDDYFEIVVGAESALKRHYDEEMEKIMEKIEKEDDLSD